MRYEQAVEYLESLVDYERLADARTWNLDRMRFMLERAGQPQRGLRAVHIAEGQGLHRRHDRLRAPRGRRPI
jgi:folylpolyglutamate synthase/dihydropteroate synthase